MGGTDKQSHRFTSAKAGFLAAIAILLAVAASIAFFLQVDSKPDGLLPVEPAGSAPARPSAPTGAAVPANPARSTRPDFMSGSHPVRTLSLAGDTDFYPLILARKLELPADVLQLMTRLAVEGDPEAQIRDAKQVLSGTITDSMSLYRLGGALDEEGTPLYSFVAAEFMVQAVSSAQSELSHGGDVNRAREALEGVVEPLFRQGRKGAVLSAYMSLSRIEPDGSAAQYRARLKSADFASECGNSREALGLLDALIADVRRGIYPDANPKDIVNLRYNLCISLGDVSECLPYLREELRLQQGTRFETRIRIVLSYALIACNQLDEATQEFQRLSADPAMDAQELSRMKTYLTVALEKKGR